MANSSKRLKDIGEDVLIQRIIGKLDQGKDVIIGAGDDCAVVRHKEQETYLLLKTDCVVEGVHYTSDTPPSSVGYKALARAISDIAAMGGRPKYAMITLIINGDRKWSYASALYRGLSRAAKLYDISIVGGETARAGRGRSSSVSVSLTGTVNRARCCNRSGGRPGDLIYVTGKLGGSLRGRHLRFKPRVDEAEWLATHFKPRAMMDLSDGISCDLPRLAKSSRCGYSIEINKIPKARGTTINQALCDGEDYELLFASPPKKASSLEQAWAKRFPKLQLSRIGKLNVSGIREPKLRGGWQHF